MENFKEHIGITPAEFYNLYYPKVFKFFTYRFNLPVEDIEDCIQKSFIQFFKYYKNYDKDIAKINTYLYSIINTEIQIHIINKKRYEKHIKKSYDNSMYDDVEFDDELFDMNKKKMWDKIIKQIKISSHSYKVETHIKIIELLAQGKKYQEVADILSIDIGTVKNLLHKLISKNKNKNDIRNN